MKPTLAPAAELAFLQDGGEMGSLMRNHDWSQSPLGSPQHWPQSLRSVVGLLLHSKFPMFVAWGPALGFLYNDPYSVILGKKHPSALGARFAEIWAEIWSDIAPLIDSAMSGIATYRENLPLLMNRKGFDEETWFTFSYSPVLDETGEVAGMYCVCTESTQIVMTERIREAANAGMRQSEARLRALVNASADAVYRMSGDWSQMLEIEGQGLIEDKQLPRGSWHESDIHPDDQFMVKAAVQRAIEEKRIFQLEHRVRRMDGSLAWILSRAVPIIDTSGNILEWFGTATDISARKENEEALERRIQQTLAERKILADIVEGTDAFVQVVGLDYRWLAVNRAAANEFERIYGVRPVVGRNMLDALADRPEHQAAVHEAWRRALEGEAHTSIGEFGDPTFTRRSYEMRFNVLFDKEGRRIGAYQFVYDVTDQLRDQQRLREAEEALRQSQKMEAVGQLTGGVAHDFNNLLAAIEGSMSLIERRLADGKPGIERYMSAGRDAVRRAATLTQRLLAFSRRQTLDPKPVDVNRMIAGMEELIRRTMGPDVDVEVVGSAGLWPTLADPSQLENSLLNLCINARDAMAPNGGRLTIETANKWIDYRASSEYDLPTGQYVSLCVTDTGTGMTPEVIARAFDPFFTTKPLGQGTGLGLSMIYGFVRQSGGQVRIYS
ncbi:MAG: PAS domain-containing protein, partial [Povalibacter sp.]